MLDFLLKPICILCDSLTRRKIDLCLACERELPFIKSNLKLKFDQEIKVVSLFSYQTPIDQLITAIKFKNNLIYARILGELLAEYLSKLYQNNNLPEIIIPVPLHPERLRERGYNQSLELSKPIAKKLKIPIDRFLVKRIKNTEPQAKLSAQKRKYNIQNAFKVDGALLYRHVAVLDDVITTGNTVNELCKSLFKVGALKIDVWCCAKS